MKILVLKEFDIFEVGETLHVDYVSVGMGVFLFSESGDRYMAITVQEYITKELDGFVERV